MLLSTLADTIFRSFIFNAQILFNIQNYIIRNDSITLTSVYISWWIMTIFVLPLIYMIYYQNFSIALFVSNTNSVLVYTIPG